MKTRNALHTIGNKVLLAALLSIPTLSGAQESSDTPTLDQLDQKIRILERKLEVQDEVTANKTPAPTISVGQDGFTLKSADENFVMKWRGLLQADYRGFVNDTNYSDVRKYKNDSVYVENNYLRQNPKLVNTFLLRRIRPVWDVTLYKYYNLRITPDFGGGTFVLLDAYGEVNFWPEFKVRIGKFTPPIGLERLQASSDNNFVEYNFPAALSPSRDVGVQISGDLLGESVNYAVGYFNGAEDGASKDNDLTDHKDFTGRLFLQPFKSLSIDWLSNLGLGTSGSWGAFWGDSTISNLPSIKSAGQNTIFSYRQNKVPTSGVPLNGVATIVDSLTVRTVGAHYRVNPQGYWYAGPFSLFGEYILSSQKVARSKPIRDTIAANKTYIVRNPTTLVNAAWGLSASWVVTGDPTSFKGVKPRHPFSPSFSDIGAIELVARAGQFTPDKKTFPLYADTLASVRKATSYGGGVNWYLSRQVKWVLDYDFTKFQQGAKDWSGKVKNRDKEQVITTRLQLNF